MAVILKAHAYIHCAQSSEKGLAIDLPCLVIVVTVMLSSIWEESRATANVVAWITMQQDVYSNLMYLPSITRQYLLGIKVSEWHA